MNIPAYVAFDKLCGYQVTIKLSQTQEKFIISGHYERNECRVYVYIWCQTGKQHLEKIIANQRQQQQHQIEKTQNWSTVYHLTMFDDNYVIDLEYFTCSVVSIKIEIYTICRYVCDILKRAKSA